MTRIAFMIAAVFAALATSPAFAHDYTVGGLKIDHPWARATPKGASVGGGYMKITNTGTDARPSDRRFDRHVARASKSMR